MEYIINFPTFLLESLGIDKNIESQAKEIFKEINGSEKCRFNLIYFIETGNLKVHSLIYKRI